MLAPTLAERLQAAGCGWPRVSSGSTGSAFLLNPRSTSGIGVLVNGYFDRARPWPIRPQVNAAILGEVRAGAGEGERRPLRAVVAWTERVLREYVLPELRPEVVINWLTEPDHSQHHSAWARRPRARPPERRPRDRARADHARRARPHGVDRRVRRVGSRVQHEHGRRRRGRRADRRRAEGAPTPATWSWPAAGRPSRCTSRATTPSAVARIARFVQARDWGGVVFTAGRAPGDPRGAVEGTFSLELIHVANGERGADLLFTFPWTSRPNAFGVPGTDLANVGGGARLYPSDHGSMSPWNVRNTFLAWGVDFKKRRSVRAPAGNVDVAPTILALLGVADGDGLDGRVLHEALADGPDAEQVAVTTQVHAVGGRRLSRRHPGVGGGRAPLRRQELAHQLISASRPAWPSPGPCPTPGSRSPRSWRRRSAPCPHSG